MISSLSKHLIKSRNVSFHHRCLATLSKQVVSEKVDVPTDWYNIQADLPVPLPPPLHPGELRPCGPEDFAPLFPMSLSEQEVSSERYIEIPEPVREVLSLWRPSPLFRAKRWEQALGLPSNVKIFYKYEGGSPSGSHKTNTAIAQIYYVQQTSWDVQRSDDRNGCWTMGIGTGMEWSPIWCASGSISSQSELWAKAVSKGVHWNVQWSENLSFAIHQNAIRNQRFGKGTRLSWIAWHCN